MREPLADRSARLLHELIVATSFAANERPHEREPAAVAGGYEYFKFAFLGGRRT